MMEPVVGSPSRRWELAAYFILTFAISWAIEIPLALSYRGAITYHIPSAIHYLASTGPLLAGMILAAMAQGPVGIRRLLGGLALWRVGRGYALFSIGSPIALFAVAVVASRLMQGAWPDLGLLAEVDYLPRLGIPLAIVLWVATFGIAEETGWRGFALPRLQAGRSALSASIILGILWSVWHLPAFFYRDTYLAMGIALGFPMLLLSVLAASITITWLYNGTRGSLLMVSIFHGLFDFFSVSSAGGVASAIVMSAPVYIWAIFVVRAYGPATLSPEPKVIVRPEPS